MLEIYQVYFRTYAPAFLLTFTTFSLKTTIHKRQVGMCFI